jgi:thioredoxin
MKQIRNAQEFNNLINGSEVVIIDFFTKWCGPCKAVAPFFEKLQTEYPHITFAKCDCEDADDLIDTLGVKSIPTFMKFVNGKKEAVVTGADKNQILELVNGL